MRKRKRGDSPFGCRCRIVDPQPSAALVLSLYVFSESTLKSRKAKRKKPHEVGPSAAPVLSLYVFSESTLKSHKAKRKKPHEVGPSAALVLSSFVFSKLAPKTRKPKKSPPPIIAAFRGGVKTLFTCPRSL